MRASRALPAILALAALPSALLACTSLLGIDGTYVDETQGGVSHYDGSADAGGEAGSADGAASGGAGGRATPDAAPATDGGGAGGAPGSPSCGEQTYQGTMQGTLTTSATFVPFVPLPVDGNVTLTLGPEVNGVATLTSGALTANFLTTASYTPQSSDLITAELSGTVSCATGVVQVTLVNASYSLATIRTALQGGLTGTYAASTRTMTGDWTAQEVNNAQAKGGGTWSASSTAP